MVTVSIRREWAAVGLMVLLALLLRWWSYGQFPVGGETKDEFAWTWLGNSLLSGEPPTSWSWFDHYEDSYSIVLAGSEYVIVRPVFDNPPLFALIPGLMTKIGGVDGIEIPSITLIRFPMILLGTLSVFLLYLVGREWFSHNTGLVAGLFYGSIPLFVLSSRLVISENLLVVWMLLMAWMVAKYLKRPIHGWLLAIGIVSGLALLTKVMGLIVFGFVFLVLAMRKKWSALLHVSIVFVLMSSLWLLYAWKFGFDVFLSTQLVQSGLTIGWGSILNLFLRLNLADKPFLGGWILLGWILLFYHLVKDGLQRSSLKKQPLFLLSVLWLLFYVLSVGEQTWHGWYRYLLFPLMSLSMARLFVSQKKTSLILLPFFILGLLPSMRLLTIMLQLPLEQLAIRLVTLVVFGVGLIEIFTRLETKQRTWLFYGSLAVMILVNSLIIMMLNPDAVTADDLYFFPIRYGI